MTTKIIGIFHYEVSFSPKKILSRRWFSVVFNLLYIGMGIEIAKKVERPA